MTDKSWCYIPVSPNFKAKIDKEDFERVSKHKWRFIQPKSGRGRVVTTISTPKGARQVTLSRFIMNPPPGKMVYARRFKDELDYRKSNLIVCTMQERQAMLPKNGKDGSSIYKGVSYSKADRQWKASIKVEGRLISLGQFDSEDEAALAYNRAAVHYFGPLAYQNRVGNPDYKRNDEAA